MKVAFYTLGCKVNQYETQAVAQEFMRHGYVVVEESETADVYVVNSCSVTRMADRKSRQYLRRMKKQNPEAVAVLMGCYPQTNPLETEQLEEADIILGTENKLSVPQLVEHYLSERKRINSLLDSGIAPGPSGCPVTEDCYEELGTVKSLMGSRRALIKVQDGCNRFCSYCIIPHARGPIRSRSPQNIKNEAFELVSSGCREIVLTGINTALYGAEKGFKNDLDDGSAQWQGVKGIEIAVKAINDIPGDFRIRLSSLEPTVVDSNYLTGLLKYEKLAHHAHLSAQSGSDRVIKSMNRHYSCADYLDMVRILKEFDPHYGITTDIIAGFPGETEEDFSQSLELVKKAGFLKVHAFPYSDRPGTKASGMEGHVGAQEKKERAERLARAAQEQSEAFRKGLIGTVLRVLPEEPVLDASAATGETVWRGHASNYTEVYFAAPSGKDMTEDFVDVIIQEIFEDGVSGKLKAKEPANAAEKEKHMSDCIFCKIANGDIPSNKAYEDDQILAFHDLDPQAPVHVLIIPKKHLDSLSAAGEEDAKLLSHIMLKIRDIAADLGLENGYRVVINTGEDGGQTVKHLHVHLLGKRSMKWPPG
ncbi:MAG: tRNA (N(6)-L-threonylcarbamoyladenosine(37)-C(2))-methylthiotransferase MtaB [Firmicutes bacterium]|nr:tRNA (N(6)-L-threonylcarbamoyladenosine(37)-C(2))-methylthiotransferase MtaB [Bacillota bacterium]